MNSFLKHVHVIDYSRDALLAVATTVETFAEAENLPAHGAAVTVRRSTAHVVSANAGISNPSSEIPASAGMTGAPVGITRAEGAGR